MKNNIHKLYKHPDFKSLIFTLEEILPFLSDHSLTEYLIRYINKLRKKLKIKDNLIYVKYDLSFNEDYSFIEMKNKMENEIAKFNNALLNKLNVFSNHFKRSAISNLNLVVNVKEKLVFGFQDQHFVNFNFNKNYSNKQKWLASDNSQIFNMILYLECFKLWIQVYKHQKWHCFRYNEKFIFLLIDNISGVLAQNTKYWELFDLETERYWKWDSEQNSDCIFEETKINNNEPTFNDFINS